MIAEIPYNRARAVEYARRWALSRNPLFIDFTGIGGNCTSFVSQCLFAGCPVMNFTQTFGWYYTSPSDRAPAWSGVDEFFGFLVKEPPFSEQGGMTGPFGRIATSPEEVMEGDIIQLMNSEGEFYHTLIISAFTDDDVLICAHSNDALDRPLSTYRYSALRVIHIEGGRFEVDSEKSFKEILEGRAILSL